MNKFSVIVDNASRANDALGMIYVERQRGFPIESLDYYVRLARAFVSAEGGFEKMSLEFNKRWDSLVERPFYPKVSLYRRFKPQPQCRPGGRN